MQQITRGDYLKDLITIYIENHLQTELTDLYSQFVFQCGTIQKFLTPAQVIKISLDEQESLQLTDYNICYLAGITQDGHKETFDGSIAFNTRGKVVFYEPTPNTSVQSATTSDTSSACPCQGISGIFANCSQPAIKAYFSVNYVPTKLSELTNDTDFIDSVDVAESISEHNANSSAHPYIQSSIVSATEALEIKISEEETARKEAVSLAISTTEGYTDSSVSAAIETTEAYADGIVSAAITTTEAYADNAVSVHNTATNAHPYIQSVLTAATNDLQEQIDGLAAASDVTDIVGTYAELQAYDTQHLNDNDIIKVLSDSTHDDEPSYYRFDKSTDTFSYIGSESAAYTKAQSNSIFVAKTTTVNNKALSSDITLTHSDVNALSETYATVISGNTSAIASNTTAIATNTSAISTINGKIPTDASSSNKLVSASTLAAATSPLANKDLSNLTTTGGARLHALKAYADNGELLTDAEGLADVVNYAHSTFDISKFTVVGSPMLTSDGIASGFSSSNDVTTNYSFNPTTSWKITGSFTTPETLTACTLFAISDATYSSRVQINSIGSNYALGWRLSSNNSSYFSQISGTYNLLPNTKYYIEWTFSGTQYTLKVSTDKVNWTTTASTDSTSNIYTTSSSKLRIGKVNGQYEIFTGSIDLKQFSITVDGVEVFSGNKTSIDTIKADDYTVVGTPTISADGVASGFSNSNYLKISNLSFGSSTWEIAGRFIFNSSSSNQAIFSGTTNASAPLLYVSSTAMQFNIPSTVGAWGWQLQNASHSFTVGNTYFYKVGWDNTNYYIKISDDLGSTWSTLQTLVGTAMFGGSGTFELTIGANIAQSNRYFTGSIDLNAFKIYVNGDLVYQPCLKIPYTEAGNGKGYNASTGSKIVNAIYRDRVNDMAEQFGYANYYTLSDTDFTLPQVELYGLIGQRTLRDSYRNGINYWELYSNRDLEQGGSCTSGVEVTFTRPFADTNYVLSVPYSAKSNTAFTPTQTGDFIAKGKGIL